VVDLATLQIKHESSNVDFIVQALLCTDLFIITFSQAVLFTVLLFYHIYVTFIVHTENLYVQILVLVIP